MVWTSNPDNRVRHCGEGECGLWSADLYKGPLYKSGDHGGFVGGLVRQSVDLYKEELMCLAMVQPSFLRRPLPLLSWLERETERGLLLDSECTFVVGVTTCRESRERGR